MLNLHWKNQRRMHHTAMQSRLLSWMYSPVDAIKVKMSSLQYLGIFSVMGRSRDQCIWHCRWSDTRKLRNYWKCWWERTFWMSWSQLFRTWSWEATLQIGFCHVTNGKSREETWGISLVCCGVNWIRNWRTWRYC